MVGLPKHQKQGRIVRVTGGEVWVDVGGELVSCVLRGRLRRHERSLQVAAGDHVIMVQGKGDVGTIEKVLPRSSWLSRYIEGKASGERLIVANIDMLLVVATLRAPPANYGFIDRVLVAAEWGQVNACVCLNKTDLVEEPREIEQFTEIYSSCGYTVLHTSAETGDGVEALEKMLKGGIYAFVGESGVGKSSLLMKMDQALDLKVRSIGEKSGRGRHATTYSQLFPIRGGYVADTPGIQTFGFPGAEREAVSSCFPEFREPEEECFFRPCSHSHEPNCSVKAALDEGRIHRSRYESYLAILSEVESRIKRKSY